MQRYQRTAKVVEAEPWCLIKAAGYLRAFVESQPQFGCNVSGNFGSFGYSKLFFPVRFVLELSM